MWMVIVLGMMGECENGLKCFGWELENCRERGG